MDRVKSHFTFSKLLIILAIGLPALIALYVILHFGVNVPFQDEWEFSRLLQATHEHKLSAAIFWEQHNEHRIFFPRLLMLALASISHWNLRVENLASFSLAAFSVGVLILIVRNSLAPERLFSLFGIITVSWIIFSPVQWENWLWGWQIQWFLMIAAIVSTIWFALKTVQSTATKYWWFLAAACSAIIASYSFGGGMFIWLAILPILIVYKVGWRLLASWLGLGAVVVGIYLVGYQDPGNSYPPSLIITEPFEFIRYFFTLIGRPLGWDIISSSMWGIGLIFIFVLSLNYIFRRGRVLILSTIPWVSLGIFALLINGLTSFSRFGAGVEQAMSSRYYAISSLFLIAVVITMLIGLAEYRHEFKIKSLLGPLVAFSFLGMLIANNYFYGIELAAVQNKTLVAIKACVRDASEENHECLKQTYPYPDVAWERVQYLRTIRSGGL